jgi:hypothetical protein
MEQLDRIKNGFKAAQKCLDPRAETQDPPKSPNDRTIRMYNGEIVELHGLRPGDRVDRRVITAADGSTAFVPYSPPPPKPHDCESIERLSEAYRAEHLSVLREEGKKLPWMLKIFWMGWLAYLAAWVTAYVAIWLWN